MKETQKSKSPRLIVSGGGTGGHIFPAIAIADAFKRRHPDAEILFVGAKGRMEMDRVPKAGYPIEGGCLLFYPFCRFHHRRDEYFQTDDV